MNDFLEQIWWGNPVKNYFITGGIILFVWLLKKFISRYFAGLLFRVVHSIWKDVDKKSFVNLVVKPLGFFSPDPCFYCHIIQAEFSGGTQSYYL